MSNEQTKSPSLGPWAAAQHLGYVVVWVRADGSIEGYADCGARVMNHREAQKAQKTERQTYPYSDPKRCRIAIARGLVR